MISTKVDEDVLIAFCVFWVISILVTLTFALAKDSTDFLAFRLFHAIPYGLHAGIALEAFELFRKGGGTEIPELWQFSLSQGLHGIVGIFLFFWTLLAICVGKPLKEANLKSNLKWGSEYRSRAFFYIVFLELFFAAVLITATALGYTHTPNGYAGCRRARLEGTMLSRVGRVADVRPSRMCNRAVTVQITAVMSAILLVLQTLLFVPLMAYPRVVRMVLYMTFGGPSTRKRRGEKKRQDEYDLEELMPRKLSGESSRLHEALANDHIARNIAQHLHFADIASLSQTSRDVYHSVYCGTGSKTAERMQLLCESSCIGGKKAECWACARLICKTCKVDGVQVYEPRTLSHATTCFAVCTKCYLLRAPAQQASWEAMKKTEDLSLQHGQCYECKPKDNGHVSLCRSCATLPALEITGIRERRDRDALRLSQGGRLWCAECQKSLNKGRRRWYICETGGHECHWEGHHQLL